MALTEKLCQKFCEELLDRTVIPVKTIVDYNVASVQDSNDIFLQVVTEEDEYNFALTLIQKNNTKKLDNATLIEVRNIPVAIKHISVRGYDTVVFEEVDVVYLKSALKSLAVVHTKSIQGLHYKKVTHQVGHFSHRNECTEVQEIVRDLIKRSDINNIDNNLLSEGIENLSQLSEDILKPTEKNVYVKSHVLQSKLIFKRTEQESVKCQIINSTQNTCLPLVYDVLLAIFYYSNQNLRQQHFHKLVEHYYHTLENNLHEAGLDLASILPPEEYVMQIKLFTPYVKLEILNNCCQKLLKQLDDSDGETCEENARSLLDSTKIVLLELYECFLYPTLRREDCYKAIRSKIGSSEYELLAWTVTPLEVRPGFLGDYFKLKIKISQNSEEITLDLFVKHLPTTNDVLKAIAIASFKKEEFFYGTFLNELKVLGLEHITDFAPKCYFTRSNDVLLFEDLSVLDYRSFGKTDSLSYETVQVVMKQLAKLHACSLLYEERATVKAGETVRIDGKYKEYMKEINLQIEEINNSSKLTTTGINAVINYILDAYPDIPKDITMDNFKEKVKKAFELLFKKVQKCDHYRNVICQGDFWGANLLFKRNKDDHPIDCCIVDYQLIRYCPPSHDLLFLIYVNCEKETRNKYMNKLIEEYYSELSKILKTYNLDLDKIYTFGQFLDSCHYMKSAAICIACLYLQLVMIPVQKAKEMLDDEEKMTYMCIVDRKEVIEEEIYHDGPYRERIRGIVEDLYEICVNNFM